MTMLDFDINRSGATPVDAATILCLRDGANGLEILCVERSKGSRFMGGAIVFPGGKVDPTDRDPRLTGGNDATAIAVAACRESFEEAGILLNRGDAPDADRLRQFRARLLGGEAFADILAEAGLTLDLERLVPFARWLTPVAESRRFDTRFFIAAASASHEAAHDARETTDAFWATPSAVLDRFARGECQLFPPTHRSLELLAPEPSVSAATNSARARAIAIVCPELVRHRDPDGTETMALTLPGDPDHSVREARVAGRSRYVLRDQRWLPEGLSLTG